MYNYFAVQLWADLEKARDELEKKQRKHDTEIEVRDNPLAAAAAEYQPLSSPLQINVG